MNTVSELLFVFALANLVLELATASLARSIPWMRLERHPQNFVASKYIPGGVSLKDPEKMSGADRHTLLEHWRNRQRMGKITLKFHGIWNKDGIASPRYKDGLRKPLADERGADVNPSQVNNIVPEDKDLVPEDDETDDSSDESSQDDTVTLPTPRNSSTAHNMGNVEDDNATSDDVPAPKKRAKRRTTIPRRPTKASRGKAKANLAEPTLPPAPEASMLTPEGTPAPAPKKSSRPKPKLKVGDKVVLKRDLQALGIIPETEETDDDAESGRRRSPRKAGTQ